MNSTINFRNRKEFFFNKKLSNNTLYELELQVIIFIISLLAIKLLYLQQIQGNLTIAEIVLLLVSMAVLGSFVAKSLLGELLNPQEGKWQGR
ncbi:MAG: hypothetical protein N2235_08145, partial [Fischerella sp.]|nr:hypothetical protein [Fischerella sp.]